MLGVPWGVPLRVTDGIALPLRVGVAVALPLRDCVAPGVPLPLPVVTGVTVRVLLAVWVALRVGVGVTVLGGDPLRVGVLDCVRVGEEGGVRVGVRVADGVREVERQT